MPRPLAALLVTLLVTAAASVELHRHAAARHHAAWDGYLDVPFRRLTSFRQRWEDPLAFDAAAPPTADLPGRIRTLDGKSVAITGFMLPLAWDEAEPDRLSRFMLTPRVAGCCVSHQPLMWEIIEVVLPEGRPCDYVGLWPVRVKGRLEIKEHLDDEGYVLAIYRMAAVSVERLAR